MVANNTGKHGVMRYVSLVLLSEICRNERREKEARKKKKRKRGRIKFPKKPAKIFALVVFSHSKRTPFFDIRGSRWLKMIITCGIGDGRIRKGIGVKIRA